MVGELSSWLEIEKVIEKQARRPHLSVLECDIPVT